MYLAASNPYIREMQFPEYGGDNSLFRYQREGRIDGCKQCSFNGFVGQLSRIAGQICKNSLYFSLLAGNSALESGSHETPTSAIAQNKGLTPPVILTAIFSMKALFFRYSAHRESARTMATSVAVLDAVTSTIAKFSLFTKGERILVALSRWQGLAGATTYAPLARL